MCITFLIVNENAKGDEYKLILASNRDESYFRPALSAAPFSENDYTFGGRDIEAGREVGTWLAFSTKEHTFKLGNLLNIIERADPKVAPKVDIVSNYVMSPKRNIEYCEQLARSDEIYCSSMLITIEISNKSANTALYISKNHDVLVFPQKEVLGFSNSVPHEPFKKTIAGIEKFRNIINQPEKSQRELLNNLMDMLKDRTKYKPDGKLVNIQPPWYDTIESIYNSVPDKSFGTRTHSVILIDADNNVDFFEETMTSRNPDEEWLKTHIRSRF